MQKENLKIIIGANYNRFQIACVFAEYNLFKPTTFIQNYKYIYIFV